MQSNDPAPSEGEDADWNPPGGWAVNWEEDVDRDYATDSDESFDDADFDEFESHGARGEMLNMVDMDLGSDEKESDSSRSGYDGGHQERRVVGGESGVGQVWNGGGAEGGFGSATGHGQAKGAAGSRSEHSPTVAVSSRPLGFGVSTSYHVRIYRADESWETVPISLDVTVADLTKLLNVTMLGENEKGIHRLFLKERGRGKKTLFVFVCFRDLPKDMDREITCAGRKAWKDHPKSTRTSGIRPFGYSC